MIPRITIKKVILFPAKHNIFSVQTRCDANDQGRRHWGKIMVVLYTIFLYLFTCVYINVDQLNALNIEENKPIGHNLELGLHRLSTGHIKILTGIPNPREFWQKFVTQRKPVLFRGAAKHFPSFRLWTDEYLRKNFGDLELKLEAKREKDHTPSGARGLGRDILSNFLDSYKTKDAYVVSQLPDPMTKDINILSCLSCGSLVNHILEADLWLSSGGTSSLLHRDADNAINCLLNGTKNWILIDPLHEQNV